MKKYEAIAHNPAFLLILNPSNFYLLLSPTFHWFSFSLSPFFLLLIRVARVSFIPKVRLKFDTEGSWLLFGYPPRGKRGVFALDSGQVLYFYVRGRLTWKFIVFSAIGKVANPLSFLSLNFGVSGSAPNFPLNWSIMNCLRLKVSNMGG